MTTALTRLPNPNPKLIDDAALPLVVGNTRALDEVMADMTAELAKVLPEHEKPERWALVVHNAFMKNPALLGCTRASILQSLRQAAELGLEPSGTLGAGYLVPYNNKKKFPTKSGGTFEISVPEVQFQPGYRGFCTLMTSNGTATKVDGRAVYDCDEFEVEYGLGEKLVHKPKLERPKDAKLIGAYAIVTLPSGEKKFLFMDRDQIETRRRASRAPDSLMWKTYPEEGYKKTVLRAVAKTIDLRPNDPLRRALELDDEHYDLEKQEREEKRKTKVANRPELRKDAVENPSDAPVGHSLEEEVPTVVDAEFTEQEAPADVARMDAKAPEPEKAPPPPKKEEAGSAEVAQHKAACGHVHQLIVKLHELGGDPEGIIIPDFVEQCSLEELRSVYARLKVAIAQKQKEAQSGAHAD